MSHRCARWTLCALMTAVMAGAVAAPASADPACDMGDQHVSELTVYGAQFVTICLVNEERAAHGLAPVTANHKLFLAAYGHATDMAQHAYFSHTALDGSNVVARVQRQDYAGADETWQVGENLAWGSAQYSTPRATVQDWMASPAHRAIMLDPAYREVGIGVHDGAPVAETLLGETDTYVAVFGRRDAEPSSATDDEPVAKRAARPKKRSTCARTARTHRQRARCRAAHR